MPHGLFLMQQKYIKTLWWVTGLGLRRAKEPGPYKTGPVGDPVKTQQKHATRAPESCARAIASRGHTRGYTHKEEKPRSRTRPWCPLLLRKRGHPADTTRPPFVACAGVLGSRGGFGRWSVECSRRLRAGGSSQNGRGPTDRPRRGRGHGRTATSDHASRRA